MPTKNQTLKNSHSVPKGRTIIQRIEQQMDKRRKTFGGMLIHHGKAECENMPEYWIQKGRYEGFGASLAILRSSSLQHEIERSNERLGIE